MRGGGDGDGIHNNNNNDNNNDGVHSPDRADGNTHMPRGNAGGGG